MRKRISIFTTIEGHKSISTAIHELLSHEGHTVYENLHHGAEFKLYTPFYSRFPHLFKVPYNISKYQIAKKVFHTYANKRYSEILHQQLALQKPDVIISTWFFLNHILSRYAQNYHKHFINIVANPRTIHPAELVPNFPNLVFDKHAAKTTEMLGVPASNIYPSGWFIRHKFKPSVDRGKTRKLLGLHPNKTTILVVSGSEGSLKLAPFIKRARHLQTPAQIVVACGKSSSLLAKITQISSDTNHADNPIHLHPLGFTNNIHRYIQAADILVGKAGPNYIFEAVACHTPFFATTHISGQEDGNLDIIKDYKLGYVEENTQRSIDLLSDIIEHPDQLKKFSAPLKTTNLHLQKSKQVLLETLKLHSN